MSRGGGGGGRGGRGGRGGKRNDYPWETDANLKINFTPSEAFPNYNVPIPSAVTQREKAQVRSFLLFREQVRNGPLYTAARSSSSSAAAAAAAMSGPTTLRAYGQEQINQRYGNKDKGTIDPFTAVDLPSSRMKRHERVLPDLADRPFSMHLFPPELHATLNGHDHPGGALASLCSGRKKTMTLSKVTTLRTAREIFNLSAAEGGETAEQRQKKLLEQLERLDENEEEEAFGLDEEQNYEEMDDAYEDEDGGDYDAEQYFNGGDDDDMDDGGGDDGVY